MNGGAQGIRKGLILFLLIGLWVFVSHAQEDQKSATDFKTIQEGSTQKPSVNRDPFRPFIKIVEKKEVETEVGKSVPPIKRYPLEQFRLVGIVWVGEQPKVMVVDPEKNTYVLGVGDEIGSRQGKIIEVRESGIMVEEKNYFEDVFGQKKVESVKSVLAFKGE
ncbi:MAG TPA: pilus assembly protein PilP [Thermodesulfobacteriota bacterium]|nr:pilus assembly protein PilP [Thermodesulfobacteriota bacterium]